MAEYPNKLGLEPQLRGGNALVTRHIAGMEAIILRREIGEDEGKEIILQ